MPGEAGFLFMHPNQNGAAEVDGPLLPTWERLSDLPPFRYIAANLLPLETPVRSL
jgi:hypothetical protein